MHRTIFQMVKFDKKKKSWKRKAIIEEKGLTWSVVESVPVHEEIKLKLATTSAVDWITIKQTLSNLLSVASIRFCYNFMPVLD
ncbi:mannonate dehydratase [Vibrio lentus]|nr:mannonate dehydratase [Vibrio lentus]